MRARTVATLLLALGTCSGCSTSTGPDDPAEILVLESVDGAPVPATLVNWPDYHLEVLADTIRLFHDDTYRQDRVERFTGIIGVPETRPVTLEGTAVRQPGRIVLVPACGPDTDCLPSTTLLASGSGYTTEWIVTPDSSRVLLYGPPLEPLF